ncbi:hypothetical protein PROFUN_01270 [Planoprotostelium fungivorum]|uniref:F-box domain-containing protein n=1 Tax=Planoprotostelium fungivorum TaxID=1890364 RepID=A0A2P6NZP1_9EUKA|nr:hypothetical protein PROFUN_01270 [Planoprotostelium fungivorum]
MDFEGLPDDLWHLIGSYLSLEELIIASRASKRWHRILWEESRRSHLDFSSVRNIHRQKAITFISNFQRLKSISFKRFGPSLVNNTFLLELIAAKDIGGGSISSHLEELSLDGCRKLYYPHVKDSTACQLSSGSLSHDFLKRVTLLGLSHLQDLDDTWLDSTLPLCSSLTDLDLSGTMITRVPLCQKSPLKKIQLSYCLKITDESLQSIATNAPKLEQLYVQGCQEITSEGLRLYVSQLSELRILNVIDACKGSVDDDCLMTLTTSCPLLVELDLKNFNLLTSRGFDSLTRLKNLTTLNLDRCRGLTDEDVENLIKRLGRTVCTLNLSGCRKLSVKAVHSLGNHGRMLQNIGFAGINLTDSREALFLLSSNCQLLRVLNVAFCLGLDEDILFGVADRSRQNLCKLNISGITVSDEKLKHSFPHLKVVKGSVIQR